MITFSDFQSINNEVEVAVSEAFDTMKTKSPMDYILFLANGDYRKEYDNSNSKILPHVIDYQGYIQRDSTRLKFLSIFLKKFYSFPSSKSLMQRIFALLPLKSKTTPPKDIQDDELRMSIELMIYSHTWESEQFIKDLYRLTKILDNKQYEWDVNVPEMGKHNFIRSEIRDCLKKMHNPIADIITNGFHTSIRNAFAHSQYNLDMHTKILWLDNYGGASWELRKLSFDEMSKRFVYSTLLTYHLINTKYNRRKSLVQDFGKNRFAINLPNKPNQYFILYDKKRGYFNFEVK